MRVVAILGLDIKASDQNVFFFHRSLVINYKLTNELCPNFIIRMLNKFDINFLPTSPATCVTQIFLQKEAPQKRPLRYIFRLY